MTPMTSKEMALERSLKAAKGMGCTPKRSYCKKSPNLFLLLQYNAKYSSRKRFFSESDHCILRNVTFASADEP